MDTSWHHGLRGRLERHDVSTGYSSEALTSRTLNADSSQGKPGAPPLPSDLEGRVKSLDRAGRMVTTFSGAAGTAMMPVYSTCGPIMQA